MTTNGRFTPDADHTCRTTPLDRWLSHVCYGVTGGTLATNPLTFVGHNHAERLGQEWIGRASEMWRRGATVGVAVEALGMSQS